MTQQQQPAPAALPTLDHDWELTWYEVEWFQLHELADATRAA
jgi:hypothetical protein